MISTRIAAGLGRTGSAAALLLAIGCGNTADAPPGGTSGGGGVETGGTGATAGAGAASGSGATAGSSGTGGLGSGAAAGTGGAAASSGSGAAAGTGGVSGSSGSGGVGGGAAAGTGGAGGSSGTGGLGGFAGQAGAANALLTTIRPRLSTMADRTMTWWLTRGVDAANGGFLGTLDNQGNAISPTDKGLIQQSRHLWATSMWYERRSATPAIQAVADATYSFIVTYLRDPNDGEFYFKANQTGSIIDSKKKMYALGFAIYGLSNYARVFGVQQAADYALGCFQSLDARTHDAVNGGYDQSSDPDSWINGAAKGTNTHIHLMEAFTALYEVTGDATVGARVSELVDVTINRLLQPTGYVHWSFNLDWSLVGSPVVSYGHDLETAWLLLDAARVVGRDSEPAVIDAARTMGVNSSASGVDLANGGYFYDGVPGGAVSNNEKVWWVQFEALPGLWWMFALTGDLVHLQRMAATLDWLEAYEDLPNGEWYWSHWPDGSMGPRNNWKGEEWKTSYHNLRSLVFTEDWIAAAP